MSIVLLSGFSQSGKDYIGNILVNKYKYKRFAFADSLKEIVSNVFDCDIEVLHSQDGKQQICTNDKLKRTYRQILIDEALHLRNIDPDIFAERCSESIKYYTTNAQYNIVITDWRYSNEVDIIKKNFKEYNVILVKVQRKGQDISPVDDISEYQLNSISYDYIIHNNLDDTIYEEIERFVTYPF